MHSKCITHVYSNVYGNLKIGESARCLIIHHVPFLAKTWTDLIYMYYTTDKQELQHVVAEICESLAVIT